MILQSINFSEFSIIPQISTAIALIAFIVAIVFYYLQYKSKNELDKIKSVKENDRANLLRDLYDKYSIPTHKISPNQQYKLLNEKLKLDYRKKSLTYKFLSFITVILGILIGLIILFESTKTNPNPTQPIPTPIDLSIDFDNIKNGDTIVENIFEIKGKINGILSPSQKFLSLLKIGNGYNLLSKIEIETMNKFTFEASIFIRGPLKICILQCDSISYEVLNAQFNSDSLILNSIPNNCKIIGSLEIIKQ
jgi:predicted Holliday junction resolvase-like endonuclease